VLCIRGQPTTCGSKILQNYRPPYDAPRPSRGWREADAVLIGKTNMDEFAMGSSTEKQRLPGERANPWDLERIPRRLQRRFGGRRWRACEAPLALGTDTGGSIRQPARLVRRRRPQGPSYGRVSRFGLVAFASSLDQVGPLRPQPSPTPPCSSKRSPATTAATGTSVDKTGSLL